MENQDKFNRYSALKNKLNSEDAQEYYGNYGEIKFRQNKTKKKLKYIFKGVTLVLIAAVSGAVSASYIIEKKYSQMGYRNNSVTYSNKDGGCANVNSSVPKNDINAVAEDLSSIIVGVSTKSDGFSSGDINKNVGSGIIFDKNGYIVTNCALVDEAEKIYVKLSSCGSKPINAKLIGVDKPSDLAVIKIEAENLPVARFADSSTVKAGDVAIAIGNPLGEDISAAVTVGIVSITNRKVETIDPKTSKKSTFKILKTDAAINSYNTGGALCNSVGEIIGINSLKLSQQDTSTGMGIAISMNEAKNIIDSITSYGKVKRPHLGFVGQSIVNDKYKDIEGVYVREVTQGESLSNAGVRPTDIIIELDNKVIKKFSDIQSVMEEHKIGDVVKCKIWREGNVMQMDITLTGEK